MKFHRYYLPYLTMSIFFIFGCDKEEKKYSTDVSVESACIFNKEGSRIACKPYLDFNFVQLSEKVHRIEIDFIFSYKDGSGPFPSVSCSLQLPDSVKVSPVRGCENSGILRAIYEDPNSFKSGRYLATFSHLDGSSNPVIQISYN